MICPECDCECKQDGGCWMCLWDGLSVEDESMKTFNRICIKDYIVSNSKGHTFQLHRGGEYLTSGRKDDHVTVFSTYWVDVPVSIFAGEVVFTE